MLSYFTGETNELAKKLVLWLWLEMKSDSVRSILDGDLLYWLFLNMQEYFFSLGFLEVEIFNLDVCLFKFYTLVWFLP